MSLFDMWCRSLCAQPLTFPLMGALPSQRPRPNAILQSWVRCSVRIMTIQFIWAGAYFLLSITRRAVLVGVLLNPVYCITALIGIYGALSLQRCLVAISIYGTILNCMIFLAFVFLNYAGSVRAADDQAWVVLALFLPGLVVDGILGLICLPLLRHLRNAQEAERQAAPSPAVGQDEAATAGGPAPMIVEMASVVEEASGGTSSCPVCMAEKPNTVLLPCKHVICEKCPSKLRGKLCPICRRKFTSTMKVYL
jgi:hypothetical protein